MNIGRKMDTQNKGTEQRTQKSVLISKQEINQEKKQFSGGRTDFQQMVLEQVDIYRPNNEP
jgi:hypothetical protein